MDPKTLNDIPPWEWPEGVGETFLGILGDDQADESDRLLTAELAGGFTVINDELAEAVAYDSAQWRRNRRAPRQGVDLSRAGARARIYDGLRGRR